MAITYVGGKVVAIPASTGTTTTVPLTDLGGSLAEGDIVFVAYAVLSDTGAPASIGVSTSGYSELAQPTSDSGSLTTQMSVSQKVMGATPDASVDITATGAASSPGVAIIKAWRGVSSTAQVSPSLLTNTFIANPPAFPPFASATVVVAFGAGGRTSISANRYTSSDLTNFLAGANDASGRQIQIGGGGVASPGANVDPAAFGFAGGDSTSWSSVAMTIALSPPAPPPVSGTSSGTLPLSGSASGLVTAGPVEGTASGELPLTGSAVQGSVATGAASGDLPLTGSASGGTEGGPISGTASGTLPLTGSAFADPPAPPPPSIPSPASPARVGRIIREFRVVSAGPDSTVVARYGNLARDTIEPIETFFDSEADAQAMADERLALLSVTRSLVTVQIQGIATAADIDPSLTLPTVTIIDDEQGRNSAALVFGVTIDMKTERSTLETWG